MKYINITVPVKGNITQYELHRAIANREEYLTNNYNPIPQVKHGKMKLELKPSVGLWNFITGCLP